MGHDPVQADPSASVVLLRDAPRRFEVLMVRRHKRGFFGGLVVFPGGGVDEADRSDLARSVVTGEFDDHDHRSAALRELAEETGLAATLPSLTTAPDSRGADLYRDLATAGVSMSGDALVLVSRWVTPEVAPRRFDTRFYLLAYESSPPVRLDRNELVAHDWVTPEAALSRYKKGEWKMFLPTVAHLTWLERRSSIDDAVASARGADGRTLIEPRIMEDDSIVPIYLPADDR